MIIKKMHFALEDSNKNLKRYQADIGVDVANIETDVDHRFITEADLNKLASIEDNANNYTHPTGEGFTHIPAGGSQGQVLKKGSSGNYIWDDDKNTIYENATAVNDGLMTKEHVVSLNNKANKSNTQNITMLAAEWVNDETPYDNRLHIIGVTMTNNIEITIDLATATKEQVEAWCNACIVGGIQSTNYVTLKAYGDKPEIDIPLIAIIRGDIE